MSGDKAMLGVGMVDGGGRVLGTGVGVYAIVRLTMFLLDWGAKRWDGHIGRLSKLQDRLDKSLADRLRHLEERELSNLVRIDVLERCVRILIGEVHEADPTNPKLQQVADLLRAAIPLPAVSDTPSDMIETLGRMK